MTDNRSLCCVARLVLAAAVALVARGPAARANTAQSKDGMVATIHPIATDAAARVLADGGNAVDAAVAAALTLGVVDGHNSGIGGGCFMLVRRADGTFLALDGREAAPALASRDMFVRNGKATTRLSQTGPLASGIPGSLAVYDAALTRAGTKNLRDLLNDAAKVADDGFALSKSYAKRLASTADDIAQFPESRRVLLKPDGKPYAQGETLKQPDLANSYRAIARDGIDWFYRGEFSRATDRWMRENGGVIRADDFANYRIVEREPLVTPYRGYTVVGFPPPSSGGVHVAQILGILEPFDLKALEAKDPADEITVVAEAMKLAFADRAYWLGDPDFTKVPRGLVDPEYMRSLSQRISATRPTTVPAHGQPPRADNDLFRGVGKHTTHVAAADKMGNWVALTCTVNTSFGSKVIIPGTGILLNNQMDDFSIEPGVANHFKLVGAEANAVAPGKRPLSSMSPTIVLKDGKPVLTVGAAGGPKIITQVVHAIVNTIDLGSSPAEALARPRFHHQWSPDELWIENTFSKELLGRLRDRGYKLDVAEPAGAAQLITFDAASGEFAGVSEPRSEGKASGPSR